MAKLYFTYGPMGSQKTTRVLADAYNFEEHGGVVLVAKPSADTKGGRKIVSRIGLSRTVDFLITPNMDARAKVLHLKKKKQHIDALLVDEANFLQPRQVDQLLMLAVVDKIPVLTYGLRTDFKTRSFPGSMRLLELAHVLRESITMCGHGDGCQKRAHFNARKVGGKYVADGGQVAIDGEQDVTYTSLCVAHYLQNVGPVTTA